MNPQSIQSPPPSSSSSSSSTNSFPILAISILGILTTSILLLSYYVFVIKCNSRRRRQNVEPLGDYSTATPAGRGLDESAIRSIPTFRFKIDGGCGGGGKRSSFHECAVCLNEFQAEERIRLLPNCFHVFHIDCIDTWLQTNANCPLCRSHITTASPDSYRWILAHRNLNHYNQDVVIEVRDDGDDDGSSESKKKGRKLRSMGDESIDVRVKDEQFSVQPMRRSFSMGSSCDRQLHLAVQEILQHNRNLREVGGGDGSARSRGWFFAFGHCRSSRSERVLPIGDEM